MSYRFAAPLLLLLLGVLPLVYFFAFKLKGMTRWRKNTILIIRTIIIIALAVAIAELELTRRSKELTVIYALDQSLSIPEENFRSAVDFIEKSLQTQDKESKSGLVVFGAQPSLELSPQSAMKFQKIESIIEKDKTNIAAALKLCLAAFPKYSQKRIVLLSDGNENIDNAVDAAVMASNNKAQVLVYPVEYNKSIDLAIEKVNLPGNVAIDSPFDVKVIASSPVDTTAKLNLYEDNNLVASEDVALNGGQKNLFSIRKNVTKQGVHTYRAEIVSDKDSRIENNLGYGFTFAKGEPTILYIDGGGDPNKTLYTLLLQEKFRVDYIAPDSFPDSIEMLQNYDSLILSNVHASSLSEKQMKMIEKAVHDLGIGLIMIGGEESFGAGGWQDTPVETALPVSMDIKQKKVLPNGAMVIILHTCEIADGNKWAQDISIAALNVLSARDMLGIVYYGTAVGAANQNDYSNYGEKWLFKLQEVRNKLYFKNLIMQVQPGDMPQFEPTMQMGYEELRKVKSQVKHMVIISDGDPPEPSQELVTKIRAAKISVSTIVISPHTPRDAEVMRAIAKWGGGNFYQPEELKMLPKIFIKEASIVRKSLIFEQTFKPAVKQFSDIIEGFSAGEFPPLDGYVCTTKKDMATEVLVSHEEDPVLCHWRYGIGKAVAFTSDAREKWAADWLTWNKFSKFWGQTIRWTLRETNSGNFQISTLTEGNKGKVIIEAIDDNGQFINFLDFDGGIIDPEINSESISIRQVSPGRYEGEFDIRKTGSYIVNLITKDKDKSYHITSGTSLAYSAEYKDSKSNDILNKRLAEAGNGMIIKDYSEIYKHNLPSGAQPEPIWNIFIIIAILLLPFDIFLRRVMFEPAEIWLMTKGFIRNKITFRHHERTKATEVTIDKLKKVKGKAVQEFEQKTGQISASGNKPEKPSLSERLRKEKPDDRKTEGSIFAGSADKSSAQDSGSPSRFSKKENDDKPKQPESGSAFDRLKQAKKRAQDKIDKQE